MRTSSVCFTTMTMGSDTSAGIRNLSGRCSGAVQGRGPLPQFLQRGPRDVVGAVRAGHRLVLAGPPEAPPCHAHGPVERRDRVEDLDQVGPAVDRLDLV